MWEDVLPTDKWVEGYLPTIVAENAFNRPNNGQHDRVDYETHRYVVQWCWCKERVVCPISRLLANSNQFVCSLLHNTCDAV